MRAVSSSVVKGHFFFQVQKQNFKNKFQHSKQRIVSTHCDIQTFYTCIYCGNVKKNFIQKENVFVIDMCSPFGGCIRQTTLDQIMAKSLHIILLPLHQNVTPLVYIYSETSIYLSRIYRSISVVPERILFKLWLPHLLFSQVRCFFFRPPTKTMNRGFTV
jgi:hypothetical protein